MAQPVKISPMKDRVVDDGIAPCPSHGFMVEQPKERFHRILYLTVPFALRPRRSRICGRRPERTQNYQRRFRSNLGEGAVVRSAGMEKEASESG